MAACEGAVKEVYQCEDCTGCPYAPDCKRTDRNRTVRINRARLDTRWKQINFYSIY
ncbi:transposase [Mitsuokella jalaludinii]|uniref:transposase n=1 Tax=Mitsuokella jalaludinii TaxID=187979 RepID=UPI003F999EFD